MLREHNSIVWKYRIDFPKEVIRKESLFTNLIVDETTSRPENHCDDAVIYISDTVEPGEIAFFLLQLLDTTKVTHVLEYLAHSNMNWIFVQHLNKSFPIHLKWTERTPRAHNVLLELTTRSNNSQFKTFS